MTSRKVVLAIISGYALLALPGREAVAQINPSNRPLAEVGGRLRAKDVGSRAMGYTVAPGIVITPSGYVEGGFDSNPDELPLENEAGFLRTGVGLSMTAVRERSAVNVSVAGTWLQLDDDFDRAERFGSAVSLDAVHTLAPGLVLSTGGLYEYDGLDFIQDQVQGAYAELVLDNERVTAFVRGRVTELRYLGDQPLPDGLLTEFVPLFLASALDARRDEVATGVMLFSRSLVAPYIEGGAANVDYLEQRLPEIVDRDAGDYYGKAGLRITYSPVLRTDIGWRWNRREVDDRFITAFSSDFLDATLTWAPSAYFTFQAAIERTTSEPITPFGRLSDVKTHRAGLRYSPYDRTNLSLDVKRETLEDIGANAFFRVHELAAEATYQSASWAQFYAGLAYQHVEEDRTDLTYERFRIGAGLRVTMGENAGGSSDPFVLPFTQRTPWHGPGGNLKLDLGPSWFSLPETAFTTIVGGTFFDEAIGRIDDAEGLAEGVRADFDLKNVARHEFGNGESFAFGFAGHLAYYEDEDKSTCRFTTTTDCALVNIDDFDPEDENNTGPFGRLETTVDRELYYWGLSAYVKPSFVDGMGFKGEGSSHSSPYRLGVEMRGLHKREEITSLDAAVPNSVEYHEDLDTYYYGGFFGFDRSLPLGHGFNLTLDGKAGVYYAYTTFEGRYRGYIPIGGSSFALEQGAVDSGHEELTFLGDAKVSLDKHFSWGRIGAYAHGEYLGYVPRVLLNNNDLGGGSPFGIVGSQVGTGIASDDAWNFSVGLTTTISLDGN